MKYQEEQSKHPQDEYGQETWVDDEKNHYNREEIQRSVYEETLLTERPARKPFSEQKRLLPWLLAAVLLLGGALSMVKLLHTTEVHTFALQPTPHIRLHHTGDIQIAIRNAPAVQVTSNKQPLLQNVTYHQQGNRLDITIAANALPQLEGAPVTVEMALPTATQLEVETENGNIEIVGNGSETALKQLSARTGAGSIRLNRLALLTLSQLQTGNGTLALKHINGQIDARTRSGAVAVEHSTLAANSRLHTIGGNVELQQTSLMGSTRMSSNTGSLFFQGKLALDGTYDFTTTTGRIELVLAQDGSYSFQLAASGRIQNEFGRNEVGSRQRAAIHVSTHAGSIAIKQGNT